MLSWPDCHQPSLALAADLSVSPAQHPSQLHQQSQLLQPPDGQAGSTNQPQSTGKCPLQPLGGPMSHPRPPSLQLLSLNVNGLRERQKRAALFAVLQAGPWHVIALQETHHATQAEAAQWCREGVLPPHGMAHHIGLLARQPAAAWPCCSRLVPFCQRSQLMLWTNVADSLLLKAP